MFTKSLVFCVHEKQLLLLRTFLASLPDRALELEGSVQCEHCVFDSECHFSSWRVTVFRCDLSDPRVWLYLVMCVGLFFLSGPPTWGVACRPCPASLLEKAGRLFCSCCETPQACEGRQMVELNSEPPLYVMMKNDQPPGKWESEPMHFEILVNRALKTNTD